MTKSEIFKKAHKIARDTVAKVGNYTIAMSLALKSIYSSMAESVEDKLIRMGGKLWENYGKKRIYFDAYELAGFNCNRYGTGNVSSGSWDGDAAISNSRYKKIAPNGGSKFFYDCMTGEFNEYSLHPDVFDYCVAKLSA